MWRGVLLREEQELQRELRAHDDILMVDVVDVYRNLPKKLLKFYNWTVKNTQFNFTLKTDDDCFVDVEAIIKVRVLYFEKCIKPERPCLIAF
ncbi:UDP-GalNAc:beta-1,3-N-acetylgalactosaminyltransferase 2-like [Orbicella faveolata]|uniref:UDP-GalNAc:beta-1, 3-N-acetylgalactosaminyltransferase 2-like n=1 Tax=Orbicella faveolata TaxID=48498 RepID=UPI0009E3149A|nr:UDP-GalNAc:beta-1,3-N-acetylgalactosaminyltransferase 2-like [Orbicella faveolata]